MILNMHKTTGMFYLLFFLLPFSRDYLRDNPHLVREDSASYLTLWCVNLEMQEVSVVSIIIRVHSCVKTCFLNLLETRIEFLSARGILLRALHVKNCSCATRVRTGGGVDSGRGAGRLVVRCIDSYLSLASSRSESSLSPELLVTRVFMQPLLYFFAKHCKILCVSVARAFAHALK